MKTKKEIEERIDKINNFLEFGVEVGLTFDKRKELRKETNVLLWVLGRKDIISLREKNIISKAPLQDSILDVLKIRGDATTSEIALDLVTRQQNIQQALKKLEEKNKIKNIANGRQKLWRIKNGKQ